VCGRGGIPIGGEVVVYAVQEKVGGEEEAVVREKFVQME
jgi:hypothetical protein